MGIQQCHNVITIKIGTLLKSIINDLLCQKLVTSTCNLPHCLSVANIQQMTPN
jgi:hypothetical protein